MRNRVEGGSRSMLAIAIGLAVAAAAGCRTFDAESQRLEEVLELAPGALVADVGAGEGEWTLEMARRVGPSGRVFATEIDPERIGDIRRTVAEAGVANVTIIEGASDDTKLPPGCCDAIFLRHVYHHITHPEAMNASLLRALRPDGFVAVIDFNPPTRLLPVPDGVRENRRGHGDADRGLDRGDVGSGFRRCAAQRRLVPVRLLRRVPAARGYYFSRMISTLALSGARAGLEPATHGLG